jgi:hypothetical protein
MDDSGEKIILILGGVASLLYIIERSEHYSERLVRFIRQRRPTVKRSAASIMVKSSLRATGTVIKLEPLSATAELGEATVSRGKAPLLSAAEEIFAWWLRVR